MTWPMAAHVNLAPAGARAPAESNEATNEQSNIGFDFVSSTYSQRCIVLRRHYSSTCLSSVVCKNRSIKTGRFSSFSKSNCNSGAGNSGHHIPHSTHRNLTRLSGTRARDARRRRTRSRLALAARLARGTRAHGRGGACAGVRGAPVALCPRRVGRHLELEEGGTSYPTTGND